MMNSIPPSSTALSTIPAALKAHNQWVCWRYEERNGKRTKAPIDAKSNGSLRYAKTNIASTWASFDNAIAACGRHPELAGVGFCFSPDDGLTGLDLDHVIDQDTGELKPEAAEILQRFAGTYCEVSPSGTGLRLFCRGKPKRSGKNVGKVKWLEVYSHPSNRYLTTTGNAWNGSAAEVTDQQAALDWLHERFMESTEGGIRERSNAGTQAHGRGEEADDATLLKKARKAANGALFARLWSGDTSGHGGDDSAADLALCNLLAFWTNKDTERVDRLFRQSGLMRPKWDEGHYADGRTYGQATIAKALASVQEGYLGEKEIGPEQKAWFDNFVFLPEECLFSNLSTRGAYKPAAFDLLAHKAFPKGWKKRTAHKLFMELQGATADQEGYHPGEDLFYTREDGRRTVLNRYRAPLLPDEFPDPKLEERFKDHLKFICGGDDAAVEQLLNWMATLIQRPGTKINWLPLIITVHTGTGKGIVGQILSRLLGAHNVGVISNDAIGGTFHDVFIDKQLIVVDEVRMFENKNERLNLFKSLVTEPTFTCNRKGRKALQLDNVLNFMAFSNYENAVDIDPTERRYMVTCSQERAKPQSYYTDLCNAFLHPTDPTGGGALLYMLRHRDLDALGFNPGSPAIMTDAKREMVTVNFSPLEQKIHKAIVERTSLGLGNTFAPDLLTRDQLDRAIRALTEIPPFERQALTNYRINSAVKAVGIELLGQKRVGKEGKKDSVYCTRNQDYWRGQPEGRIREYFLAKP